MSSPALNLERGRVFKAEAPRNLIHLNLTREHLCVLVVCMRMNRQTRRKPQICPGRWWQITVSSTTHLLLLCTDTCFNSSANIVSKHCFQLMSWKEVIFIFNISCFPVWITLVTARKLINRAVKWMVEFFNSPEAPGGGYMSLHAR